jgi:hypothetical protein
MNHVKSISSIDRVFETACKPVLVLCSDLEYYLCKYNTRTVPSDQLFREYLAASFLKLWELSTPDFAIVDISPSHIPTDSGIGTINIPVPCFGSLYDRNLKEVDSFIGQMPDAQKKKFADPSEFFTIAFFDIWMSNEDRHQINYNLMLSALNDEYHFVPIDHGLCFNSGNLSQPNYTIGYEESLLSSPLTQIFYKLCINKNQEFLIDLQKILYPCINSCKKHLNAIVEDTPDEWKIEKNAIISQLSSFLFSRQWIDGCIKIFLEYLQKALNSK